jgi:hypothetical protein
MQLQYIPTQDIGVYWDKIKPSLENMARSWRVEDAYCELKEGRADLFLTIDDDNAFTYTIQSVHKDIQPKFSNATGYIITQRYGDNLHIWAAYNDTNDVLEKGLESVKQLAQTYGLKQITFKSYRKAWDKVAPKLGFKRELWTYDL